MLELADVESAATRIKAAAVNTPIIRSDHFDKLVGRQVFFKAESLQRSGSFKFRGAYNRLCLLGAAERQKGVASFSSGNFGKALALTGNLLNIPVVLVLPKDAPAIKAQAARDFGAEVILYDPSSQNRAELAREIATQRGLTLVQPYDDYEVMAGGGTCALELINEVPVLDAIVVPIGGGGLIAGCGVVAKGLDPDIKVYGVEPRTGDDVKQSLQQGRIVTIPDPQTIAEGIRTNAPGELTFPILEKVVDEVLLVSDDEIVQALEFCFRDLKLVVEAASATAVAAIKQLPNSIHKIGVIISGGNIEPEKLLKLLS